MNPAASDGRTVVRCGRPGDGYDASIDGVALFAARGGGAPSLDGRAAGGLGWVRARFAGVDDGAAWACATSDAFARALGGRTLHRRCLVALPGGAVAATDEWTGRGRRRVVLEFRLAPGWRVESAGEGAAVLRRSSPSAAALLTAPGFALEAGFDDLADAPVVRATRDVDLPARVVHAVTAGEAPVRVRVRPSPAVELTVEVERGDAHRRCHVPRAAAP